MVSGDVRRLKGRTALGAEGIKEEDGIKGQTAIRGRRVLTRLIGRLSKDESNIDYGCGYGG